jgi:ATP-dependent DNA helicase RecG
MSQSPPGDGRILGGFGLEDLDGASVEDYRERLAATKPGHPWLRLDERGLLEKLGCWRRSRETGNHGLTLAGLLMFGRHEAIAEAVPNYFVDYRGYSAAQPPAETWSDRLFPDGTWEANLFQFFLRSWHKLTSDVEALRAPSTEQRTNIAPVHVALREALVNAIVHTDYSTPGGIVFERYRESIVMENPGTLMVSPEQLRRGGVSQCRNNSLQRMFTLIGGSDQAGAGFRRIQEGWRSQCWPDPNLRTQGQPDRVRLELVMRSVLPEQLLDAVWKRHSPPGRGTTATPARSKQ